MNGEIVGIPQAGTVTMQPGTSLSLEDVSTSVEIGNAESLQIIVSDSLGGAGWIEFRADTRYGEGTHVLHTHRDDVLPADTFPGSPGGRNQRPTYYDAHEFEITFTIDWIESEFTR